MAGRRTQELWKNAFCALQIAEGLDRDQTRAFEEKAHRMSYETTFMTYHKYYHIRPKRPLKNITNATVITTHIHKYYLIRPKIH
jgi:hypothetical protein